MEFNIKGSSKSFAIKALSASASANKFPDVLLAAGGVVYDSAVKAKIRIKATFSDGSSIKTWKEAVNYIDVGGGAFGHMFEGKLIQSDDWNDRGIVVTPQIDVGQGYEDLDWQSLDEFPPSSTPGIHTIVLKTANGAGTAGCAVSLQIML
jgi:hypothetical protein